jgi:hypothetical protein
MSRWPLTAEERFWSKVQITETCWLWTACLCEGYGRFYFDGKVGLAHIFSFRLFGGLVPLGMELDHLCRIRRCVHPKHLEPVTHRENCIRGESLFSKNSQKLFCKRGHPLTPANVYLTVTPYGYGRSCKTCRDTIHCPPRSRPLATSDRERCTDGIRKTYGGIGTCLLPSNHFGRHRYIEI